MSENEDQIIQTTIRMPVSLHKLLTDSVQRRKYTPEKTSIDALVQDAIRAHLGGGGMTGDNDRNTPKGGLELTQTQGAELQMSASEISPDQESMCVRRLLKVLQSGHVAAVRAITSNLLAFEELVDARGNRPAPARSDAEKLKETQDLARKTKALDKRPRRPGTSGEGVG
jgi:hypothetical protein